jgi:protein tyrosine phosphatase
LRKLILIFGEETLEVDHIQNDGWVDDTASPEEFLFSDIDTMLEMMKIHRLEQPNSPVIVHCSAGIGRTGTLIAIFNIVESMLYTMENITDIKDGMLKNQHLV